MMRLNRIFLSLCFALFLSAPALADWTLITGQSSLSFVSIKKDKVAEVHHFRHLSGQINGQRAFEVSIDLNSVATNIPIRDERMRKLLFETASFPVAKVSGTLPDGSYEQIGPGEAANATLTVNLALHGVEKPLTANVVVVGLTGDQLLVTTRDPVIVNADAFGLAQGIEKLREVAKLPSIATAVPVNFVLVFERK